MIKTKFSITGWVTSILILADGVPFPVAGPNTEAQRILF